MGLRVRWPPFHPLRWYLSQDSSLLQSILFVSLRFNALYTVCFIALDGGRRHSALARTTTITTTTSTQRGEALYTHRGRGGKGGTHYHWGGKGKWVNPGPYIPGEAAPVPPSGEAANRTTSSVSFQPKRVFVILYRVACHNCEIWKYTNIPFNRIRQ